MDQSITDIDYKNVAPLLTFKSKKEGQAGACPVVVEGRREAQNRISYKSRIFPFPLMREILPKRNEWRITEF